MCLVRVAVDFGQSRVKYVWEKPKEIKKTKEVKPVKDNKEAKEIKNAKEAKEAKEIKDKVTYEKGIFPNRYSLTKNNSNSGYYVERPDHNVEIGGIEGINNREDNKIRMEHVDDILLVIASQIKTSLKLSDDVHIDLITLLPPTQFRDKATAFKEKIQAYGVIEGTVDGMPVTLHIDNVKVRTEGIAQIRILNLKEIKDFDNALLLDVGSSTIDVVSLERVNNVWKIAKAGSIDRINGAIIIEEIASGLSKEYPRLTFKEDDLERKMYYYINEEKHNLIDEVEYASDKISTIDKLIINPYYRDKGGKILLSGGGAEFLHNSKMFQNICSPSKPILLDEEIRVFGNAKGALIAKN